MLSSVTVGNPKRRMTAEGRRRQILDVAHAIVDAEGFHAATPNRIAETAGINRSLIYQLFGDPAGLFVALIDREAARAGAQFAEAISGLDAVAVDQSLMVAFDGVLAAVDAHPATWRLFLFLPQGAPPELYARLAQSQAVVLKFSSPNCCASTRTYTIPNTPRGSCTLRVANCCSFTCLTRRPRPSTGCAPSCGGWAPTS